VSWEECLDDLAHSIRQVVDTYGPDAFGLYTGTYLYFDSAALAVVDPFFRTFESRSRYSTATVDAVSKMMVQGLVAGDPRLFPSPDFSETNCLILIGTNPVVSHGAVGGWPDPLRALRDIAQRGSLWVLDPRVTESALIAPDHHVQLRAGTDHAILAYLVRGVLRDGADWPYINRYVSGYEKVAAAVEPFTSQLAADISSVDRTLIERLLNSVRKAGRIAAMTGTGPQMSPCRNISELLTWALCAFTGSLDRRGGLIFNPGYYARHDSETPMEHVGFVCGPGPKSRPDLRAPLGQYPCAAMSDEIETGNLRALLVVGGNPANALPQTSRIKSALEHLDVLATCDVVMSPTALRSTHVLACTSQLEQPETLVYDRVYPAIANQYSDRVVSPHPKRRPIWWIIAQLGKRFDIDLLPGELDPEVVSHEEVLEALVPPGKLARLRGSQSAYVENGPFPYGWVLRRGPLNDHKWEFDHPEILEELKRVRPTESLVMIPRREVRHMNSVFYRETNGRILVNTYDADDRGISDGDFIQVTSSHGEIRGYASVTPKIARGTLSIPHGYDDLPVNELLSDTIDVDPLSNMVTYSAVPVDLAKINTGPP
jgi:anaerobic selenocysteine-containing dehydrogenase